MVSSLLVKLAMLSVTLGVVFWIGWQAPQIQRPGTEAVPADTEPSAPLDASGTGEPRKQQVDASQQAAQPEGGAREARRLPSGPLKPGPLDLNRASAEELQALPGIGPVLAQRVVEYRSSSGGFRRVEDLRQVKGIGAKKFDRVRTLVRVAVPTGVPKTEKRAL